MVSAECNTTTKAKYWRRVILKETITCMKRLMNVDEANEQAQISSFFSRFTMLSDVNYVHGDQNVQVPAHLNFGKFMLNHLRKFKNDIAIVNSVTKEALTYGEFATQVVNISVLLKQLGVQAGDVIGVGSEARNEFVPTTIAIISVGAIFSPLDKQCGKVGLLHKLSITRPKYFICSAYFWTLYGTLLRSLDFITTFICFDDIPDIAISLNLPKSENIDLDYFEPVSVKGQGDVAMVLYSSGTTGMPKGVMLTHLNCILNSLPDEIFKDESTVLVYGDWYHNYDIFMTYKFLNAGKNIIYSGDYVIEHLVKAIYEHKANIAILIPGSVMGLTKLNSEERHKLDSLKVIYSRSAPLHVKTMEQLKIQYPNIKKIIQGYGMTEAGEPTSEKWATKGTKTGSIGMASPGTTLKIVDISTRESLGPNKTGEICVKGPVLMKGYIGVDPSTYLDEQMFLKTGDLGYYDEDGYFFIIDRIKEIMNTIAGDKIAPMEVEIVLLQHPGVKEAAVVGKRDPELGDLPTAFVVKQQDSDVTENELIDFVAAETCQIVKLTGGLNFVSIIPRNPRGKILRRQLRESLNMYSQANGSVLAGA